MPVKSKVCADLPAMEIGMVMSLKSVQVSEGQEVSMLP